MCENDVLLQSIPSELHGSINQWIEQLLNTRRISILVEYRSVQIDMYLELNDQNLMSQEEVRYFLIMYLRLAVETIDGQHAFTEKFGLDDSMMNILMEDDKTIEGPISFKIKLSKK